MDKESISKKQFTHLDVYFDLDKRLISVEGQEKFFRPKEFDLAYLLMSNPGVVFTREILVGQQGLIKLAMQKNLI